MPDEIQNEESAQRADESAQLAKEAAVVTLAQANHQFNAAREYAEAAMARNEFSPTQASDYILAFSRQAVAAKDAAARAPAPAERPTPLESIVAKYEAPLTPLGQRLVPQLAREVPEEAHGALALILRDDLPRILAEVKAGKVPARDEDAVAALKQEWGRDYADNMRQANCGWNFLSEDARRELTGAGARLHLDVSRLLSKIGGIILGADTGGPPTAAGVEWLLDRGDEDHEDRERAKAEAAAQERAAQVRFGYERDR